MSLKTIDYYSLYRGSADSSRLQILNLFKRLVYCQFNLAWVIGLMRFTPGFKAADAGFTLHQKSNSVKAALVVTGLSLVFKYYLSFLKQE